MTVRETPGDALTRGKNKNNPLWLLYTAIENVLMHVFLPNNGNKTYEAVAVILW